MTEERHGDVFQQALLGYEPPPTPEEEEALLQRALERAEVRKLYLKGQMAIPQFREWLMDVLISFGAFMPVFGQTPAGFPDPMATMFSMGRKSAGEDLWIMFDDAAPDMASLMRRERAVKK